MVKYSALFRSFHSAAKGFAAAFREEQNFRIQVIIGSFALLGGIIFQFQTYEWTALFLSIGVVLSAELCNSVLERILDVMKPRISVFVGTAKDIMSAAVLVSSVVAFCVAVVLFGPRFINIFTSLFD